MFFILSKTAAVLLQPSNLIVLIGVFGAVLLVTRFARAGRRILGVAVALFLAAGLLPLGAMLGHALESRFPPWDATRGAPDGVIVLGGAISPVLSQQYGQPSVSDSAGRVIAIARLARDYPNARFIYSGGDPSLSGGGLAEAPFLVPLLDSFGVARERVTLESRSRNTSENAVFSKAIALPKPGERWLLVTSAQHMPRAVGSFRQAGFAVEPYPVDWRTRRAISFAPRLQFGGNLARLDNAAHEWLGLFVYWVTGRTSELLPSP